MNQIKFINNLSFSPDGKLVSAGSSHRGAEIHMRQGDLDGACAVYSLMMMLIMNHKINRRELIEKDITPGYGSVRRLQDEFLAALPGVYKDGYFFWELKDKLSSSFKKVATARTYTSMKESGEPISREELHDKIIETLKEGNPVQIGFTRKGGNSGHSVVAIGYQLYSNAGDNLRLFCLDPGYELPSMAFWNCIIDINLEVNPRMIYQDYCFADNSICDVDEILIID